MDTLSLRNIRVTTRIGMPAMERRIPQELLISLEFLHPISAVAKADDSVSGIDYDFVIQCVQKLAATERKTIERFAEDLAEALLKEFKPEGGVRVTVGKHPPLPLESASVTITRP